MVISAQSTGQHGYDATNDCCKCCTQSRSAHQLDGFGIDRSHVVNHKACGDDRANTSQLVAGHTVDPFVQDEESVPAAVLVAEDTLVVIAAVNVAREYNLTIAVYGGGHWSINARSADNGLTVDLSQMLGVVVDPVQQTAVVQGGALGGDVLHAAEPWGLGLPWGDANVTGMGLALGGGIGLSMRQHGLTCDNILAAQIVIANGSLIEISSRVVYAGNLILPDDANFTTLQYLLEFTSEALAEYPGLGVEVWSLPGQAWITVNFHGPETMDEKVAVFAPLRQMDPISDLLAPGASNFYAVNDYIAVASFQAPAKAFVLSGLMSEEQFNSGGLEAMLEANRVAMEPSGAILLTDWLGGAVENTTSYTPFNGAYMHYFWAFPDPDTDVLLGKAAELQNMMADHTTYFYPYDNLATDPNPEDNLASKVGGEENLEQLQYLKGLLDPENLFRNHQLRGLTPDF
ncbi:hypothetical protein WJX82_010775 [Trebouxia sp. C0006]